MPGDVSTRVPMEKKKGCPLTAVAHAKDDLAHVDVPK